MATELKPFRVEIIRKETHELDIMARNVAHAQAIANVLIGESNDGSVAPNDLHQFLTQNPPLCLDLRVFDYYTTVTADEVEVEWVHDNFDVDEEEA